MLAIVVSTIAFFAAAYFIRGWMNAHDIPKGMTRGITLFTLALAVSYVAGWLVGRIA
jgi:VIT1/CCC1 family predicted Fe2+/Mn2+ transporter